MRLRTPEANIPLRGFFALQPETGRVINAPTISMMVSEVLKYRSANNLPIEKNIRRQVEIQICATMHPDEAARLCEFLDDNDANNPAHLRRRSSGVEDLENFGKAVKAVMESAAKGTTLHVSQEEADRRGAICGSCPKNIPIASCSGCGTLGSIYRSITSRQSSSYDYLLRACDVCGCDNKTQVHFTAEVLKLAAEKQGFKAAEFPEWCWKREVLKNDHA